MQQAKQQNMIYKKVFYYLFFSFYLKKITLDMLFSVYVILLKCTTTMIEHPYVITTQNQTQICKIYLHNQGCPVARSPPPSRINGYTTSQNLNVSLFILHILNKNNVEY